MIYFTDCKASFTVKEISNDDEPEFDSNHFFFSGKDKSFMTFELNER